MTSDAPTAAAAKKSAEYGTPLGEETRTYPLATFEGEKPKAPQWFVDALAAPRVDGTVAVEGAKVAWRRWGETAKGGKAKPGLVFIHGGAAHLGWWDAIAPFFAKDWSPCALSLSGMGDSDRRDAYPMDTYADEVTAVAEAAGLLESGEKPVIVGHSFGGFVTLVASSAYGDRFAGAVICDSPIRPLANRPRSSPRSRSGRVYPTLAEALARFRLLPDQDNENPFLLDHVAREGLVERDGGWAWKHDPEAQTKLVLPQRTPIERMPEIKCPMAFMRGEQSALCTDEIWDAMAALFAPAPMISIPEARHHLILDQPLAFVAALRGLLAAWPVADRAGP